VPNASVGEASPPLEVADLDSEIDEAHVYA